MILYLLAFLGGILTILSPCILPVLPLVFSGAGQSFRKSGLPLLVGMAGTFALFAALATYTGAWVVKANQVGRAISLVVFAIFGLTLLFPKFATWITTPLVRLGARFQITGQGEPSVGQSVLLGVSTGLLWAPCAGPILGLILTGAAVSGPNAHTALLLLAFAAGAATSLAVAMLAGARAFSLMKRSLGAEEWIRRGLGVAVLAGVVAIATGLDTGILRKLSLASSSGVEQSVIDRFAPGAAMPTQSSSGATPVALASEGTFPGLDGAVAWLNSGPLTADSLAGKVIVVDFWTYSCINCLRSLPYVEAWAEKYRKDGLVVVGVHTPEFAFERDTVNVAKAVKELGITYPVAIDNRYSIWNAFHNQYWPAHYFIDAKGVVRYHHFGEGSYDESEEVIRQLLREKGAAVTESGPVQVTANGAQLGSKFSQVRSPETYVGYSRAASFASPGAERRDAAAAYTTPAALTLNQWGLVGKWTVHAESATLDKAPGSVRFRFHARDLHLVIGPSASGKPIRFKVTVDGAAPGASHGMDVDGNGNGIVTEYRLYQLVRQAGSVEDRTFEITFEDPGVEVYAFTFG